MNDRLREIFERNKQRQPISYWKFRERSAYVVSACAFLMSAFTLYTNTLLQKDDFRVIPSEPYAEVVLDKDAKSFLVRKLTPEFTFMNMGNRPVAVTDITITALQPGDEGRIDCDRYRSEKPTFKLATAPFTLKAGELLVSKVDAPNLPGRSDQVMHIPVEHPILMSMGNRVGPRIALCGFVNVVTPGRSVEKASFNLFSHEYSDYEGNSRTTLSGPIPLIQRNGTIFDY